QTLAAFGQLRQANAQNHQALVLANLHRVIDEPCPILGLFQGHRQQGMTQTQQPQPTRGPMRNRQIPAESLRHNGQHAWYAAQRHALQRQTQEQTLQAHGVTATAGRWLVIPIQHRYGVRIFLKPRPALAGPRFGLPIPGHAETAARLAAAISLGSWLHRQRDSASAWLRSSIPYTSASSACGSDRGTRLGPGTMFCTSLRSSQDLLLPCATPFACLGRGPPVHQRNKSEESEQAQNVKMANNFHQPRSAHYGLSARPDGGHGERTDTKRINVINLTGETHAIAQP